MSEYELISQKLDTFIRQTDRRLSALEEAEKKSSESMGVIKTAIELIKHATTTTNESIARIELVLADNNKKLLGRITNIEERVGCIEREPSESFKKYKTVIITIFISAPLTALVTAIISLAMRQ